MNFSFFKRYKAVAYLATPYAVLQYVLLRPSSLNDTLFLFDSSFFANLTTCLPHSYIVNLSQPQSFMGRLKLRFLDYSAYFIFKFLSRRCKTVYISSCSLYANYSTYCFDHVIYLEDGVDSYRVLKGRRGDFPPVPEKRKLLKRLLVPTFPIYPSLGWADKVEKMYLTGILPIPTGIADKVEIMNLKELWSKRSPEEQAEICRIFLPGIQLSMLGLDREVLLLTQCFSEDSGGIFSEQDTIEIYQTILAGIDESTVLIKVHPREKTDYKKYFPRAEVIHTPCPMELLSILGFNIKKAITVTSTAIYCLDDSVEKRITGMSVTPKLHAEMIRRWGVGYEFGYQ